MDNKIEERYIFLDFDGVLNKMEYQTALQWKGEPGYDEYGTLFGMTDRYKVKKRYIDPLLNKSLRMTEPESPKSPTQKYVAI